MGEEDKQNWGGGEDDIEDDFFRQITEIQSSYDRGRPRTREEISPDNRTRKNKWDNDKNPAVSLPGIPKTIPPGLTDDQLASLLIRVRIDEITKKLTQGPIEYDTKDDRSRSPTPVYDNTGKRTNTREQRTRDKLAKERHNLVTNAQQINPTFKPPSDYQPIHKKKTMKIYIPVKDHPDYNFIGLIIGPRGNTQKKMEKESGAKIAIRGQGSLQDGKVSKPQYAENDDDLHVLLTADTQEQLEKAAALVRPYLVPVEEGKNEHKRQQLRELAEMNGTLRERPAFVGGKNWQPVDIKCVHCGEVSHPSSDCPLKNNPNANMHIIESEYLKLLSEIKDVIGLDDNYQYKHNNNNNNINNNMNMNMNMNMNNNSINNMNSINNNNNIIGVNNNNGFNNFNNFGHFEPQQPQQHHHQSPHHQSQHFNGNMNNTYQSPPYGDDHPQQHWGNNDMMIGHPQQHQHHQQHHQQQQQWGQKPQHNSGPYGPPGSSPYGPQSTSGWQ